MQELLNFAMSNGIINVSHIQEQMDMAKRDNYLKQHQYSIGHDKDGNWYTYLPDAKKGRRFLKRKSKELLENEIVDFYKKQESAITFLDVYKEWREYKDQMAGSDNTVVRYDSDFKRYFDGNTFCNNAIDSITEDDVNVFIKKHITEKNLPKKAAKTLFGYIHNTLLFACRHKYIDEDPMRFMAAKDFYKYCVPSNRSLKEQVINDNDYQKLLACFQKSYNKRPNYIPIYAVEFASLTGMRVGEIAALTWDSITDDYIIVNKSEKYNRKTKQYYIEDTKNKKHRVFPLTDEIKILLNNVKKVELQYGYICEYVFANESGRVHTNIISSCIKNKCRQLGIEEKGIHAYRKTLNSKMRCNGVSSTVAASLLGHSKEVNENYYTFDISDIAEKAKIVSEINGVQKSAI